jgi:hypothetical protein
MNGSHLLGAVCGYVSILMSAAWSVPASASIVYDFIGDCTSVCTGQGAATLTLTDDYNPGDSFTIGQFVSMSYLSTSIEYSFSDIGNIDSYCQFNACSERPRQCKY